MSSCLALTVAAAVWAAPGEDAALRAQFLGDAVFAWRELRERAFASRFDALVSWEFPGDEPARHPQTVRFNGGPSRFRYERVLSGRDQPDYVAGRCSRYAFIGDSKDAASPLRLAEVVDSFDLLARQFQARLETAAGLMLDLFPLESVVRDPSFRLIAIAEEAAEPPQVRVRFACRLKSERGPTLLGGELVCVPDWNWAPIHFQLDEEFPDGPASVIADVAYDEESRKHGLPRLHELSVVDPASHAVYRRRRIEFREIGAGDVSEELCRVSAFGLPEPYVRQDSRSRRLFAAINLAGLAILLLGGWLYRRSHAGKRG